MIFSFTEGRVRDELLRQHAAGLDVEGVFERCLIDQYSVFDALKTAGVPVYPDGNQAILHHKVMTLDGKAVVTGSFNFSENAERHNNESCLILQSPVLAAQYEREFARVREAAATFTNLPAYDHPACQHAGRLPP